MSRKTAKLLIFRRQFRFLTGKTPFRNDELKEKQLTVSTAEIR